MSFKLDTFLGRSSPPRYVFNDMCYLIYMSTDYGEDLSRHNSALIRFEKDFSNCEPEVLELLQYKYHWYIGSKAGCSCTFRHLLSVELDFGEPVDWYEEQPDEIEATKIFYDVVASLISSGNRVDCMDIWSGAKKEQIKRLTVDLLSITRDTFRFFENHHFVFSNTGKKPDKRLKRDVRCKS